MRAITVKQPWASLIIEGIKDVENRTWKCPDKYVGKRVLIHAGLKPIRYDNRHDIFTRSQLVGIPPVLTLDIINRRYPLGEIIGSVEIVDCVLNHHSVWAEKTNSIFGERGVYNWILANPIKFKTPVLASGALSFWESYVEICHICGEPTSKDNLCKICGEYYCDECDSVYNQFTQIDFNCCQSCASRKDY